MTRRPFGGGPADVATQLDGDGRLIAARTSWVTIYTGQTGGPVADLLAVAGGAAVSAGRVASDPFGMVGSFLGPDDETDVLWGDAGSGDRIRLDATDVSARVTTLEGSTATTAALTAETVRAEAAESLLVPQTTTIAGHPLSGPVTLVKADVGLGNVDNTADASKPVSTAQGAAIAAAQAAAIAGAPVQSVAGRTGTVTLAKTDVGLGSVDNTADSAKPVSIAQQAAFDLKAPLADAHLTGTPTAPTAGAGANSTQVATTAYTDMAVATQHTVDSNTFLPFLAPSGDVTGVTDDTNFAASLAAGLRLRLRQGGAYYTAAGWVINVSNFDLDGAGSTLTAVTPNLIRPLSTDAGGNRSKLRIRNLEVTTAGDNVTSQVYVQDASDVIVANVKAGSGRWGIRFHNVTRGTARHCEATGQTGAAIPVGIYFSGTSSDCRALENYVHDSGGLGIFFDSTASSQTILGHKCIGNTVTTVSDNGIRFQTNIAQPLQGHYVVTGNYVDSPGVNCIRVNGYGATVTGNTCRGGQAGIRDTGDGSTVLTRSTISGNVCINTGTITNGGIELHGTTTASTATLDGTTNVLTSVVNTQFWPVGAPITGVGIPAGTTVTARDTGASTLTLSAATTISGTGVALGTLGSSDIVISGNYVEGYLAGINAQGAHFTIVGNECQLNANAGIWGQGLTDSTVSGNVCRNNGLTATRGGIEMNSTCSDVVITGNRCFDDQTVKTQAYGIILQNGSDFMIVSSNNVRGNLTGGCQYLNTASSNVCINNIGGDQPHGTASVAASPAVIFNNANNHAQYVVMGGTVSLLEYGHNVSGSWTYFDTGMSGGVFYVPQGDRLRITYTVAPTVERMPIK